MTKTIQPKNRIFQYKEIGDQGLPFLKRLSIYFPKGSIKFHLMLNDDRSEPHTHPWDFYSFHLLGSYKENLDGTMLHHHMFSLIKRTMNQKHRISLYRIFGFKIPCLTVGFYTPKKQLCSFCQSLGYCKSERR